MSNITRSVLARPFAAPASNILSNDVGAKVGIMLASTSKCSLAEAAIKACLLATSSTCGSIAFTVKEELSKHAV